MGPLIGGEVLQPGLSSLLLSDRALRQSFSSGTLSSSFSSFDLSNVSAFAKGYSESRREDSESRSSILAIAASDRDGQTVDVKNASVKASSTFSSSIAASSHPNVRVNDSREIVRQTPPPPPPPPASTNDSVHRHDRIVVVDAANQLNEDPRDAFSMSSEADPAQLADRHVAEVVVGVGDVLNDLKEESKTKTSPKSAVESDAAHVVVSARGGVSIDDVAATPSKLTNHSEKLTV